MVWSNPDCVVTIDGISKTIGVSTGYPMIDNFDIPNGAGILHSLYCETNGKTYPSNVPDGIILNVANNNNYKVSLTTKWVNETCTLDTQVLIDIANAIREKCGFTDMLPPSQFKDYIENVITFTITGISYSAINGMTWEEWVNSPFNTASYAIQFDNFIVNTKRNRVLDTSGAQVVKTNTIVSGHAYKLTSVSID